MTYEELCQKVLAAAPESAYLAVNQDQATHPYPRREEVRYSIFGSLWTDARSGRPHEMRVQRIVYGVSTPDEAWRLFERDVLPVLREWDARREWAPEEEDEEATVPEPVETGNPVG